MTRIRRRYPIARQQRTRAQAMCGSISIACSIATIGAFLGLAGTAQDASVAVTLAWGLAMALSSCGAVVALAWGHSL